jgi:hypothetical protein
LLPSARTAGHLSGIRRRVFSHLRIWQGLAVTPRSASRVEAAARRSKAAGLPHSTSGLPPHDVPSGSRSSLDEVGLPSQRLVRIS